MFGRIASPFAGGPCRAVPPSSSAEATGHIPVAACPGQVPGGRPVDDRQTLAAQLPTYSDGDQAHISSETCPVENRRGATERLPRSAASIGRETGRFDSGDRRRFICIRDIA